MKKKMETLGPFKGQGYIGVYIYIYIYIEGLYKDNGKENGNYRTYRGYIEVILGICHFQDPPCTLKKRFRVLGF